jgi:hypothetical protein
MREKCLLTGDHTDNVPLLVDLKLFIMRSLHFKLSCEIQPKGEAAL